MNKTTKTIFSGAFALLVGLAANMALAAEGDNFVDEASAKGSRKSRQPRWRWKKAHRRM